MVMVFKVIIDDNERNDMFCYSFPSFACRVFSSQTVLFHPIDSCEAPPSRDLAVYTILVFRESISTVASQR